MVRVHPFLSRDTVKGVIQGVGVSSYCSKKCQNTVTPSGRNSVAVFVDNPAFQSETEIASLPQTRHA